MKNYKITIDGTSYNVQVEEVSGEVTEITKPAPAPEPAEKVEDKPEPVKEPVNTENAVESPMPGTILDVKVAVGDKVEKNQVLVILEAMKMENEIVTPNAGTVTAIHVEKGSIVKTHAPLVTVS